MDVLSVRHTTVYRYRRPVRFGPHQLLIRPRDGHDLRLLSTDLEISPRGTIKWVYDVLGNSVTIVTFDGAEPVDELRFVSRLRLQRYPARSPRGEVEAYAVGYPFVYSMQERIDLGRMLEQHYLDPTDRIGSWARSFVLGPNTDTLALLGDLNTGIRQRFGYQTRDEEGTQSPVQTIDRGWGTCRDFAVLLAEAVRSLGFGARVVTGYLYSHPEDDALAVASSDTTHAWTEIFVPGPGWIAFDPTNGTVGSEDLIRVAVARDIHQIAPVSGTYIGPPDSFAGLDVEVVVEPVDSRSG